jgi:hypothetical protein
MEVKTINPVLVNPADTNINGYSLSNSNNPDLMGQSQNVDAGSVVVKGTNPVFVGDRKISSNEFLYSEQVELDGEVLTPMDEFLYSNANGDRKAKRQGRRAQRKTTTTVAEIRKAIQDIPGGPSKIEQEAKLKEGKFWNGVKGGWDSFKTSPSGLILIDSLTNYLAGKLGGGSYTDQGGGDTTADADNDPNKKTDEPMSKTTKTLLIVGGVAVVGFILYSVLKKGE